MKVAITIPIRDRERMLKEVLWMNLYDLDFPKLDIILYFHTNDNADRTFEFLMEMREKHRQEYSDFVVEKNDYGVPPFDNWDVRHLIRPTLCKIFNRCLEFGRDLYYNKYFSIV